MSMCAEATASVAASTNKSPTLLSHRSPNCVQPMPTIATRSRMPLLAIYASPWRSGPCISGPRHPSDGTRFPEIVVDAVGGEELAERHLDPVADLHGLRVDVGHLALEAAAALEVDHRGDDGR